MLYGELLVQDLRVLFFLSVLDLDLLLDFDLPLDFDLFPDFFDFDFLSVTLRSAEKTRKLMKRHPKLRSVYLCGGVALRSSTGASARPQPGLPAAPGQAGQTRSAARPAAPGRHSPCSPCALTHISRPRFYTKTLTRDRRQTEPTGWRCAGAQTRR